MWIYLQFIRVCCFFYCWKTFWSGLSAIYYKHNFFHQSDFGRDVKLQNTHIFLFKSPRDVMQVSTLNAHLGQGSEQVDFYRDAMSVLQWHSMIDLSPRKTIYCVTAQTPNAFLQKFFSLSIEAIRVFDDEQTKIHSSPSVPISFPQVQSLFFQFWLKKIQPVSLRMHKKSAQRKPAKHKKGHQMAKF